MIGGDGKCTFNRSLLWGVFLWIDATEGEKSVDDRAVEGKYGSDWIV